MADAPDSKSGRGNPVRVQVPPPAPKKSTKLLGAPTIHTPLFLVPELCPSCAQAHQTAFFEIETAFLLVGCASMCVQVLSAACFRSSSLAIL